MQRETAFFQVFLNLIQLQKGIQQRHIPLPKEIRKAYVLLETEEPTAKHELEQNETQGVLGLPVLDKSKTITSKGLYE